MEKEFIPYEQALALKELGFDEECFAWYVSKNYGLEFGKVIQSSLIKDAIIAPTYSQAFRLFREKHGLFGEINLTTKQEDVDVFEFFVLSIDDCLFDDSKDYNIYEEAELECLTKLIEICKK